MTVEEMRDRSLARQSIIHPMIDAITCHDPKKCPITLDEHQLIAFYALGKILEEFERRAAKDVRSTKYMNLRIWKEGKTIHWEDIGWD